MQGQGADLKTQQSLGSQRKVQLKVEESYDRNFCEQ
jgi:hypothetical protein